MFRLCLINSIVILSAKSENDRSSSIIVIRTRQTNNVVLYSDMALSFILIIVAI